MNARNEIADQYFEWMHDMMCGRRYSGEHSFRSLLSYLHDTEFVYSIPNDGDRADEGIYLRYKFAIRNNIPDYEDYLYGPCSILEMMVALAIHCEENIMDNTALGDRTAQWFWGMVTNLGLGSMTDSRFDIQYVEETIAIFLNRDYEPDGRGGLFRVRNCDCDLRTVSIWRQMSWYLGSIV